MLVRSRFFMERRSLLLYLLGAGQFAFAGTGGTWSDSSITSKATFREFFSETSLACSDSEFMTDLSTGSSSQPYSPWHDHF